ncbi:unnamed protein product [Ixodes pacificus]
MCTVGGYETGRHLWTNAQKATERRARGTLFQESPKRSASAVPKYKHVTHRVQPDVRQRTGQFHSLPPKTCNPETATKKRNPPMGWSRPQTVMPKAAFPDVETQEPPLPLRNDGRRICERRLASGIESRRGRPASA